MSEQQVLQSRRVRTLISGIQALEKAHGASRIVAGCRVAAELGAGVVVSHFTGAAFGDLVKSCPAPVLATSQNPALRPLDVLALTYQAVKAGARGAMFGPQILSSPNPAALVKALSRVVKQEADPDAAAAQFGVR